MECVETHTLVFRWISSSLEAMRNDDLLKCFIFHLTSPFVVLNGSASNGMFRFQSRLVLSLINTIYVSGQWITAICVMNYIKGIVYGRSVICCVIKLEVVGLKIDRSLAGDGIYPSVTLNRLFEVAYESSFGALDSFTESWFYRRRVTFPLWISSENSPRERHCNGVAYQSGNNKGPEIIVLGLIGQFEWQEPGVDSSEESQ